MATEWDSQQDTIKPYTMHLVTTGPRPVPEHAKAGPALAAPPGGGRDLPEVPALSTAGGSLRGS